MFSDHEIYGVSQMKKGQGMKPKECSEIKAELDDPDDDLNELILRMKIEEYRNKRGSGLRRAGNGIRRSGSGLRRAGNGLLRSGAGMSGMLETSDDTMIGGCYECECEDLPKKEKEKPKIGQELKELMIKRFCK